MYTKKIIFVILILFLPSVSIGKNCINQDYSGNSYKFVIVSYVSDNIQERSVRAFIKSVRELSGKYRDSKIYIVLGDEDNFPCNSLKSDNVFLLPLKMDDKFKDYPLVIKAYAAAQVEQIVKEKSETLAWFDPATLVLNSLEELDLNGKYKVSIRPVSLQNKIGIEPEKEPNNYWAPIYKELKINYKELASYETIVDKKPIQPYFNCEIFSVDPSIGILTKWVEVLTKFLEDDLYQKEVCNTFLRRLFLHQAVLSAVIVSKTNPDDIKNLSIKTGYPFTQHERLAEHKQIETLDALSAVIFDYQWERNSAWQSKISADQKLNDWLTETYIEYLELTENLYRIEGSCNSYLITTEEGSVLIDPAGAATAPEYFRKIIEKNPLKAVLLTHAHQDHWENSDIWIGDDTSIKIIAQEGFNTYNSYRRRLLPLYSHRGEIFKGNVMPDTVKLPDFNPLKPTLTFNKEYSFEMGGYHFKMVHTPGETPDHATIWIPELKAVFVGDNYYRYFINNATLRGTSTRPILGYIKALNLALSYEPEFFLPGHDRPVVSRKPIQETVKNLRDVLQYINDETIKGINEGKDVYTLMREIKVPDTFTIRPYFGKTEWTIRGVYHENIGWFDENPSSMYSLPPSSIFKDLLDLCGTEAIIKKAEQLYEDKEYVKVLHITDVILESEPNHKEANDIRIKALKALKGGPYNYIEHIWLNYGIKTCEIRIKD